MIALANLDICHGDYLSLGSDLVVFDRKTYEVLLVGDVKVSWKLGSGSLALSGERRLNET